MCGSNAVWRDRKQGLLKPLPVPERKWREISIDFIVRLPESYNCTNIMVIRDRLGKGVIIEPMEEISVEYIATKFLKVFYAVHGLLDAIISD